MSNYQGWTAGRHWREAMALAGSGKQVVTTDHHLARARFHLAAAQLLLDHPPVDALDEYPVGGREPSRDWREN